MSNLPSVLNMTITSLCISMLWISATGDWRESLKTYYRTDSEAARRKLESEILADSDCTEETLLNAIRKLQLWDAEASGIREMELRVGRRVDAVKNVTVSVPDQYDPAKSWPVVITLHGQGQSAGSMMQMTRAMLGSAADEHIIVAPQDLGPLGFTEPSEVVDQPRQLLISVRKKFHIDSDRVFLMGYSIGGHNTWMAGIMHADCFAGIMPLATPLQVIGNDMLYDVLTPNLRNLHTLFVWGAKDNLGQDGKPHPKGGNAAMARKLASAMRETCGDQFIGIELPDAHHGNVRPPPDEVKRWLSHKRVAWPLKILHRFRLPEQSDAGWVQAEGLKGKPLTDGIHTVKVKPGDDPQEAQKRRMSQEIGEILAIVDAPLKRNHPTVKIRTRRGKVHVLLFSDSLLNLDRGAVFFRNNTPVWNKKLTRDRTVMLRETFETWDFSRIPQIRMVLPPSGKKVTFGYPSKSK